MVHDVSMAVVGLQRAICSRRSDCTGTRIFRNPRSFRHCPTGSTLTHKPVARDAIAKVQVMRTLSGKRFSGLGGESEKGILEGYLRAFAAAKHYIYLETQYFTDGVITDALVESLKAKSNPELILVVPIKPDLIFCPRRQEKRIEQLRDAGGDRVGVFTRWTYDAKGTKSEQKPYCTDY